MSGTERQDARATLAAYAPGRSGTGFISAPSAAMRPVPGVTSGVNTTTTGGYYNRGGYYGGNYGGYTYAPSYGYGYGAPVVGGSCGGLLSTFFGCGATVGIGINGNGVQIGVGGGITGGIVGQQQVAPYDCIIQDQMGRRYAVRAGQPIPPGYGLFMQNPDWWTWMSTPNLY